jgi:hypothetical protein
MFEVHGDGVVWQGDGETLDVRAWGPDSLRVRSRLMGELLDTDYALLPPQDAQVDVELEPDVAAVRNGRIEAVLRRERDVYLPSGGTWTELHAGGTFDGGQVVAVQAPLSVIPVFAGDGTHPELVGTI